MRALRTGSTGNPVPLSWRGWAACAAVLVLLAGAAKAADPLVSVDFKTLDLTQLPEGWSLKDAGDVSLKDDAAKGKVLCLNHKAGNNPTLDIKLDITKVRGCKVKAVAQARCSATFSAMPGNAVGPQLLLLWRKQGGQNSGIWACCKPEVPG
ncbi:MAG: hypothetical protein ABSE73_21650, partial [Planctomycetota bacterium]